MVSEQIPEPLASVSSRKLQESDDESGSAECISAEMPVAEGYRFVHMESLREFLERAHSFRTTVTRTITLYELELILLARIVHQIK